MTTCQRQCIYSNACILFETISLFLFYSVCYVEHRLTIELTEVKAKWDSNLAVMSHDSVSRDLELQALHDTEGKLKTEVKRLKQDVERYILWYLLY